MKNFIYFLPFVLKNILEIQMSCVSMKTVQTNLAVWRPRVVAQRTNKA